MSSIDFDISICDHKPALMIITAFEGELGASNYIKSQMKKIITHYIECTWGACYNTKFKELIQPYFDDVSLLDNILRSELIREKGTVIVGKTGARIFIKLLIQLKKCKSRGIRNYLEDEFPI